MGMLSRMSTIVKSKMNRILDNAEDPRETLDYSYEKQLEMLRNVKRGVVEMVAAKRQIQQQADKVRENIDRLDRQSEQALDAGREDLALLALGRKPAAVLALREGTVDRNDLAARIAADPELQLSDDDVAAALADPA